MHRLYTGDHTSDIAASVFREAKATLPQEKDNVFLKALNHITEARIRRIHEIKDAHYGFKIRMQLLAIDGKVAVIESGMDCDCVTYDGRRHLIDATVEAYRALEASIAEWADGPFSLRLASPVDPVQYRSRDNALEAYEDGHPHHVIARSPEDEDDGPMYQEPADYDEPNGPGAML